MPPRFYAGNEPVCGIDSYNYQIYPEGALGAVVVSC